MKQSDGSFSFQYYVDMGSGKIGHIFINQDSNPYVESSKFCAKYQLSSIIVTILGDAILEQIDQERMNLEKRRSLSKQKQERNEKDDNMTKTIPFISDTLHTDFKEQLNQKIVLTSYLETQEREQINEQQVEKFNVFQNLYNNYKEIQLKKEIKRKKSLQNFSFKPQINQHSDKIVAHKRKMTERSQNHFYKSMKDTKTLNERVNIMEVQKTKPHISYNVTHCNRSSTKTLTRQNSREQLYRRNEIYLKKSQQKKKRLRDSLQKKLMEPCSFKPRINSKLR